VFAALTPRAMFHLQVLTGNAPRRVVFLHIPKCGGTSINHHFKSNFGGKRTARSVLLDSVINASDPEAIGRAKKAQFVAGHFGWSTLERVREGAITFTVLREPFDRLRALYAFARKPRRIAHPAFAKLAEAATRLDFARFCLNDDPDIRAMTDNAITRTLAADYFPIIPERKPDTASACSHLDELDFVADVARLSEALPRLAKATHTTLVEGRAWLNQTRAQERVEISRRDFLADSHLRARIAQDLDVYDYAQSLMH
jgi:hypothetical protein